MADHFLVKLATYQNNVLHSLALVAVDGSASGAVVRSLSRDYDDLVAAYAAQESASQHAGSVPEDDLLAFLRNEATVERGRVYYPEHRLRAMLAAATAPQRQEGES